MSVEYTKKTWYDGSEGGTPITAAELNRVETGIDDVVTQSNADKTNIDTHLAKKVNSSDGAHGLRYYNSELDYYDDTNEEWVEIQTGGGGSEVIKPYFEPYLSQASRNYAIGDNIYVQQTNTLYVATAVITDLDELEVGVNIAIVTDEGTEVCVEGIPNSGVYYNLIGLLNSNGTVTPYGNTKASDDIANKTLTNIHDTTTTDVEYRASDTNKTFQARRWTFVNDKYVNFSTVNNTVYTLISENGYDEYTQTANNLPATTSNEHYIFYNDVTNTYVTLYSTEVNVMSIYCSQDLITWTKIILPNSSGSTYEDGDYDFTTANISKPFGYQRQGNLYIAVELWYTDNDSTAVISIRDATNITITNSNLVTLGESINSNALFVDEASPYYIVVGNLISSDGYTFSKYTTSGEAVYINRVGNNYHVWCRNYQNQSIIIYSTTDFSTFTEGLNFFSAFTPKYSRLGDFFDYMSVNSQSIVYKEDNYFVLGSRIATVPHEGAVILIPSDLDDDNSAWIDLPDLPMAAAGVQGYAWMKNNPKVAVYSEYDDEIYNIMNLSPFTSEVGKALAILDVNSGSGGSGTDDYEDLTNLPSINGVELLGNKVIGLLSSNIQVDSDKIGYNNAISGLSATNVKSAIDEVVGEMGSAKNMSLVNVNSERILTDSDSSVQMRFKTGAENGDVSCIVRASGNSAQLTMNADSSTVDILTVQGAQNGYQTKVTASTTDLTPGTSSLTTGFIYVVYE